MQDYSKQNFIFRRGKIFINDWLQTKPYTTADSVDSYYTSLANRVADTISFAPYSEMLGKEKNDILMASLYITGWFEDICSDLGIWKAVNTECRKRYGAPLPFYDMEDYEEGAVNLQDLRLLIWDLAQEKAKERGSIINPENPYLEMLALDLFELLSDEYELAPSNERLYCFVHDPLVVENYWEARGLISWFHFRCYTGHRNSAAVREGMESLKGLSIETPDSLRYSMATSMSFTARSNILSLTTPHFLSRIRGDERSVEVFESMKFTDIQPYLFLGFHNEDLLLKNMYDDEEIILDSYSLDMNQMKKTDYKAGKTLVNCSVLRFNGSCNLCGGMMSGSFTEKGKKKLQEDRMRMELERSQQESHRMFLKASGGETYIVVADLKALSDFHIKMNGVKNDGFEAHFKKARNMILYTTPSRGFATIPYLGDCICSPKNPCYDKKSAAEHALAFFVKQDAVPYSLACRLQDDGVLPDAYINSVKGIRHGRSFLHKNGKFFTDYFFESSREYDLEK